MIMKLQGYNKSLSTLCVFCLLLSLNMFIVFTPIQAGEIELTDLQNAKLARHRARERVMKNEKQGSYIDEETPQSDSLNDDECGTVDIGNILNDKGIGGPKKIDVIITGDVINANNDCD